MDERIVYFEKPGRENTAEVLKLVKERAKARGIRRIVLASTRGDTARAAAEAFAGTGLQIVAVPWQFHLRDEQQRFPQELVASLQAQGHRVHFGTMLFHTGELYGVQTPTVMANLLRTFCQGAKVCIEIIMMATDGGCLEPGEKVIAVAGSGGGADTAFVATAAPSTKLGVLRIHEIICKPM